MAASHPHRDRSRGRTGTGPGWWHPQSHCRGGTRGGEAASVPGVSGLLTANPFYNKPVQEGQYRHFRAIAEAVPCPVVLYNIPSRTGTNLEPATILRLAEDVHNIQGVKESSGNLQECAEFVPLLPPSFAVLAGDDVMALPVIALGGAGLVSVASNEIPSEMTTMVAT